MNELPDRETLERLFPVLSDAATALENRPPSPNIATAGPAGSPVVAADGRKLHSGRNPEREARRWVRDLDLAEATVVVLLGYGSGYHARAIAERTAARLIVFEPNLDILAAGLRHGPIPPRAAIVTDPEKLGAYVQAVLQGPDRGVIASWAASVRTDPPAYREALRYATEAVGRAKLRHQTATLRGRAWLRHYVTNLAHVAKGPAFSTMCGGMAGTPAIIVAAGPSLDKNAALLRDVSDSALVLTVNTAAAALARADVRPHALVTIESADVTQGLRNLPWLDELPAFVELTAHPAAWDLPLPTKIPISVDTSACSHFSNKIDPELSLSAGFCVANAAVAIAHRLGCNPIIVVGSDLAYAGERIYASGTMFEKMRAKSRGDGTVGLEGLESRREIERRSAEALGHNHTPDFAHTLTVENWDQSGEVVTTGDFKMFRDWYTYFAEKMAYTGVSLINATEGGAHIPGWRHMPLAEVIERHELAAADPDLPVSRRFAELLTRDPIRPGAVRTHVISEMERVQRLLALAEAASSLVEHDPDGDLRLDPAGAGVLAKINEETRQLLGDSSLAQEAVFVPVDQLRQRGDISTHAFYASLIEPLQELADDLAQLLQRLGATSQTPVRRAS